MSAKSDAQVSVPDWEVISNKKDDVVAQITVYRQGTFTIASANVVLPPLHKDGKERIFRGVGATHKYFQDKESSTIGDSLAIGRSLLKAGHLIINDTMEEVHARCKSQYENPFSKLADSEIADFQQALATEAKRRKLVAKRKETQRKKYLAAAAKVAESEKEVA